MVNFSENLENCGNCETLIGKVRWRKMESRRSRWCKCIVCLCSVAIHAAAIAYVWLIGRSGHRASTGDHLRKHAMDGQLQRNNQRLAEGERGHVNQQ